MTLSRHEQIRIVGLSVTAGLLFLLLVLRYLIFGSFVSLVLSESESALISLFLDMPLTGLLFFLPGPIFTIIYLLPPGNSRDDELFIKKRVLRSPRWIALYSAAGWILALLFFSLKFFLSNKTIVLSLYYRTALCLLLGGAVSYVLILCTGELLNRFYLYRRIFKPQEHLSEYAGTPGEHFIFNFLGLFFSLVFVPLGTFLVLFLSQCTDRTLLLAALFFYAVLSSAVLISFSLSRYSSSAQIKELLESIGRGDFSLPAWHRPFDETAFISDSLYKIAATINEKEEIKASFSAKISPNVREQFTQGKIATEGAFAEGSLLNANIEQIIPLLPKLPPKQSQKIINRVNETTMLSIENHDGYVSDNFNGSLSGLFGVLEHLENHSKHALDAALMVLELMDRKPISIKTKNSTIHFSPFIGIHSGAFLCGRNGSISRSEYGPTGIGVKQAQVMASIAPQYGTRLLISEACCNGLGDKSEYSIREIDLIRIEALAKPFRIFEVYDCDSTELKRVKTENRELFKDALTTFREGDFEKALKLFKGYQDEKILDPLPDFYIQRCTKLLKNPPPEKWNGAVVIRHSI